MDVVNLTLTLSPAHYRWTFGDSAAPADRSRWDWRPLCSESSLLPSLVQNNDLQSSFKLFDQGGFPVHLTATWEANAAIHVTPDGATALDETVALADRFGDYDLRYQVRESQPVIVR